MVVGFLFFLGFSALPRLFIYSKNDDSFSDSDVSWSLCWHMKNETVNNCQQSDLSTEMCHEWSHHKVLYITDFPTEQVFTHGAPLHNHKSLNKEKYSICLVHVSYFKGTVCKAWLVFLWSTPYRPNIKVYCHKNTLLFLWFLLLAIQDCYKVSRLVNTRRIARF